MLIVAVASSLAYAIQRGGPGTNGAILDLVAGLVIYLVIFLLGVRFLGDEAMRDTLSRFGASLWRRLRRTRS